MNIQDALEMNADLSDTLINEMSQIKMLKKNATFKTGVLLMYL